MTQKTPLDYKNAIQSSGFDMYSPIEVGDANFWIPTLHIESLLNQALKDLDLSGLALRTRSKVVKTVVCEALGYPVPKSLKRHNLDFLVRNSIYTPKNQEICKSGMKSFSPLGVTQSSRYRIKTLFLKPKS